MIAGVPLQYIMTGLAWNIKELLTMYGQAEHIFIYLSKKIMDYLNWSSKHRKDRIFSSYA
jgi:hypothetical protein